jgi:hypothetical protein
MASALELQDTSNLEYALLLGDVETDSGSGPISNNSGWVRTGQDASTTENCNNWTSASASHTGRRMILRFPSEWNDPATQLSPWEVTIPQSCAPASATNVWCIED